MADERVLVGDVGGTHARFAVVNTARQPFQVTEHEEIETTQAGDFQTALNRYLDHLGSDHLGSHRPSTVSIAVAGPVTDGKVRFTNSGWEISEQELHALGFSRALLINDFAALAFSVTTLPETAFRNIGPPQEGLLDQPITMLGAGTGFGVSCLARFRGRAVPLATEGGHIGFAPRGNQQMEVVRVLGTRFGHVSVERVLSGPGLQNIYGALQEMAGAAWPRVTAEQISERAEQGDTGCRAAQDMFCAIYGAVAGDFALAHGARGGVYIAGGIASKIEAFLQRSNFRAAFEDKGRLSDYVKPIPTKLIIEPNAAFFGAALASLEFTGRKTA